MSEQQKTLPFGLYIHGVIDSKKIDDRDPQKPKFKILVNIPGDPVKHDVQVSAIDYEKLAVGEIFKCCCSYNIFKDRLYWRPTSA